MDMNSSDPKKDKSWTELVRRARASHPPADMDILPRLRRTLEEESGRREPRFQEPPGTHWLEEIGGLFEVRWMKPAFGLFACGILLLGWQASRDWPELTVVWGLQIPGLTLPL